MGGRTLQSFDRTYDPSGVGSLPRSSSTNIEPLRGSRLVEVVDTCGQQMSKLQPPTPRLCENLTEARRPGEHLRYISLTPHFSEVFGGAGTDHRNRFNGFRSPRDDVHLRWRVSIWETAAHKGGKPLKRFRRRSSMPKHLTEVRC